MGILDTSDMNLIDHQRALAKGTHIQFACRTGEYVAKCDVTVGELKELEGSSNAELFNSLFSPC